MIAGKMVRGYIEILCGNPNCEEDINTQEYQSKLARQAALEMGWRVQKGYGWICPACVKLKLPPRDS